MLSAKNGNVEVKQDMWQAIHVSSWVKCEAGTILSEACYD